MFLAFWDGNRLWRVRFSPDEPGKWTYKTLCSDRNNKGLRFASLPALSSLEPKTKPNFFTSPKEAIMKRINSFLLTLVTGFVLTLFCNTSATAANSIVEQWTRFEDTFQSSRDYNNPVQDTKVTVEFTSPSGNKRMFLAFWDGNRVWRVRFSPDEPGKWTYKTLCSDRNNKGLHNQAGSFQCEKYRGVLPLYRYGELRLSDNRRYFVHADGTPFFWLADTVWCGPALSDLNDWNIFLKDRLWKEFTAIQFVMTQWRMTKTDADGNPTGFALGNPGR
jgi:hypothetical protein